MILAALCFQTKIKKIGFRVLEELEENSTSESLICCHKAFVSFKDKLFRFILLQATFKARVTHTIKLNQKESPRIISPHKVKLDQPATTKETKMQ
jgi:hypothetical protein